MLWNGSFAANQFIRYESKSNSYGLTIEIIDIYFHSFIESHFHFIYICMLSIIAEKLSREAPKWRSPKERPEKNGQHIIHVAKN